jgi:hypothetical protein
VTTISWPVKDAPITHALWREEFAGQDGITDDTGGDAFKLTLPGSGDVSTLSAGGKYHFRGYTLQVTVAHSVTLAAVSSGPAKTYDICVKYDPPRPAVRAGTAADPEGRQRRRRRHPVAQPQQPGLDSLHPAVGIRAVRNVTVLGPGRERDRLPRRDPALQRRRHHRSQWRHHPGDPAHWARPGLLDPHQCGRLLRRRVRRRPPEHRRRVAADLVHAGERRLQVGRLRRPALVPAHLGHHLRLLIHPVRPLRAG